MDNYKFKVGDKVIGKTKSIATDRGRVYPIFEPDYIRIIAEVIDDKILLNGDNKGGNLYFYAKDFKLVEPKESTFPRDFYVKVNSQEEADKMFDYLESKGEKVHRSISNNRIITLNGDKTFWYLGSDNVWNLKERPLADFIEVEPNKDKPIAFEKGDYIVLLSGAKEGAFKLNYCYKQRQRYQYIRPELDCVGSSTNGWPAHHFNKSKDNDWRYATSEEIKEYDRLGKPYDVDTLSCVPFQKEKPIKASKELKFEVGKWYKNDKGNLGKCVKFENDVLYASEINMQDYSNYEGFEPYAFCPGYIWKEASLEEIQQYLPDDHPDKIEKEFVLPELWCVRVDAKCKPKVIYDWREEQLKYATWGSPGYINCNGHHDPNILKGYTEITLEQFKKYVLKESDAKVEWWKDLKKGDCVVSLVNGGNGQKDYIYSYKPEYDSLDSLRHGYVYIGECRNLVAKSLRKATKEETELYHHFNKPIHIDTKIEDKSDGVQLESLRHKVSNMFREYSCRQDIEDLLSDFGASNLSELPSHFYNGFNDGLNTIIIEFTNKNKPKEKEETVCGKGDSVVTEYPVLSEVKEKLSTYPMTPDECYKQEDKTSIELIPVKKLRVFKRK